MIARSSTLLLTICTYLLVQTSVNNACSYGPATYKVTFTTFWSQENFPNQYPLWRPNAQWSPLVGRTHSESFKFYHVDQYASDGLREFAEFGTTEKLDGQIQGTKGLLDTFRTENIKYGTGSTSATLFVDELHTKVSVAAKIVPSPDWFVGVSDLDLCQGGEWLDTITLSMQILDAGTDRGFAFTSPNWEARPQEPITVITSKSPSHPASSFLYPELDHLPDIANLTLEKIRDYGCLIDTYVEDDVYLYENEASEDLPTEEYDVLSEEGEVTTGYSEIEDADIATTIQIQPYVQETSNEIKDKDTKDELSPDKETAENLKDHEIVQEPETYPIDNENIRPQVPETTTMDWKQKLLSQIAGNAVRKDQQAGAKPIDVNDAIKVEDSKSNGDMVQEEQIADDYEEIKTNLETTVTIRPPVTTTPYISVTTKRRRGHSRKPGHNHDNGHHVGQSQELFTTKAIEAVAPKVDCEMGWGEWSPCSKTCGYGTQVRSYIILVEAQNGGRECRQIVNAQVETQLCGSIANCQWSHFSFSNWGNPNRR